MSGVHAGGLTPTSDWAKGLSSVAVRSFKCEDDTWLDGGGKTEKGGWSRWVGYPLAYVEYSDVPRAVATVFDKAIDSGC